MAFEEEPPPPPSPPQQESPAKALPSQTFLTGKSLFKKHCCVVCVCVCVRGVIYVLVVIGKSQQNLSLAQAGASGVKKLDICTQSVQYCSARPKPILRNPKPKNQVKFICWTN